VEKNVSSQTPGESEDKSEGKDEKEEKEPEEAQIWLDQAFFSMLQDKRLADVIFHIGEAKLPAHRLILATASPIFEVMLYPEGEMPVAIDGPIEIKLRDVDAGVFEDFLKGIYTDELQVTPANFQGLIKLATKYQVDKIQALCSEFVEGDLSKDNAWSMFEMGPSLLGDEDFGVSFIEENAEELMKQDGFLKVSKERLKKLLESDKLCIEEIDLFEAVRRWAQAQAKKATPEEKGDEKKIIADLLPLIRFPTMEVATLASAVATSGLLPEQQLVQLFSYCSVPEEVKASLPPLPFSTTSRAGGGSQWQWDAKNHGTNITITGGITATTTGSGWASGLVFGNKQFKSGNHYWELSLDHSTDDMFGVIDPKVSPTMSSAYSSARTQVWFVHHSSGTHGGNPSFKSSLNCSARTGDKVGVALDWDPETSTWTMSVFRNGTFIGTPFSRIPPPVVPCCELYSSPARVTLNLKAKRPPGGGELGAGASKSALKKKAKKYNRK
jgi:hypothetical protein